MLDVVTIQLQTQRLHLRQTSTAGLDFIVTVCNEVAKVMFLQVCVCPQGGLLPGGGSARGEVPLPGGGACSRGVSQHALRQTPP